MLTNLEFEAKLWHEWVKFFENGIERQNVKQEDLQFYEHKLTKDIYCVSHFNELKLTNNNKAKGISIITNLTNKSSASNINFEDLELIQDAARIESIKLLYDE